MLRVILTVSLPMCIVGLATPTVARADDRPPCSDEADVVKNMKQRDPSLAYPTNPSALEHLEAGKRAFGVQQYDKVIAEYTAAGLADAAPLILYDLAQTYRAMKQYEKAIPEYELFLERGRPGPEVRALVTCHMTTMKLELNHAASTAPPSGPPSEPTGAQSSVTVASPHDRVPSSASAQDDRTSESNETTRWTGKRKLAVGLALGGVALFGAGTVFAIQGQNYKDDASRLCPSTACVNADQANALSDRASTRATLANVSFGVGAGFVVGAVVLWVVGAPSARVSSGEAAIIPQVTPTFSGIAYGGRF